MDKVSMNKESMDKESMDKESMHKDVTPKNSMENALSEKNPSEKAKKTSPKQMGIICLILAVMLISAVLVFQKAFSENAALGTDTLSETTLPGVSASADISASEPSMNSEITVPFEPVEPTVPGETIVAGSDLPSAPDALHPLGFFWSDEYAVILGGETSPIYVEGLFWTDMYSSNAMLSQDHTAVAFVMNVANAQTGDLWYSDGTKAVEVAKQVGVNYYLISNDGSTVAYITGADDGDAEQSLYVYNGVTGVSKLVTENAYPLIALSPKGESIAYAVQSVDGSVDSIQGYYSIQGGEPQELGKNCYGVTLTDNGEVIYYYSYDDTDITFCALHDETVTTYFLCDTNSTNTFIFSNDVSQVLYSTPSSSSATYFSQNGALPEKVFDSRVNGLVEWEGYAFEGLGLENTSSDFPQSNICYNYCIYSNKPALCNQLFLTNVATKYFDAYLLPHTVASGTSYGGFISRSENVFCYITENSSPETPSSYSYDLMCWEDYLILSEDPSKSAQKIAENVGSFMISQNHTLYFQDSYGTGLYVVRDQGEPQLITDQYVMMYDVADFEDACVLYYLTYLNDTYTLFSLENKEGAIPTIVAQGVETFTVDEYGVAYYATDGYYGRTGLYFSADGINYEWIMSRVYTHPTGA